LKHRPDALWDLSYTKVPLGLRRDPNGSKPTALLEKAATRQRMMCERSLSILCRAEKVTK
jgi:hypothetical protein